jgi:steroid 5-alpha reductase family enzyme
MSLIFVVFLSLWIVVFLSLRLRSSLETFDLWFAYSVWLIFTLAGWDKNSTFHYVVLGLITIWSVSLIGLVYTRTLILGGDFRYQETKNLPLATLFQVIGSVLTASPALCHFSTIELVWYRGLFLLLALVSLCLKLWCDFYLLWHRFQKRGLLTSNFWKIVRYPHYFFEILFWTFIALANLNAQYWWIGLASPAFIAITLNFFSGIPMLERRLLDRYGFAFSDYCAKTPKLIPLPKFNFKCIFRRN